MQIPPASRLVTDEPRSHHYLFTHVGLRDAALDIGPGLVRVAAVGRLMEGLRILWDDIGGQLPEEERQSGEGLAAFYYDFGEYEMAVVAPPPPEHITEAYLAVVVVPAGAVTGPARYFLLEHAWTVEDEPATVLTEWTREGHVNLGEGPQPDQAEFLGTVLAALRRSV